LNDGDKTSNTQNERQQTENGRDIRECAGKGSMRQGQQINQQGQQRQQQDNNVTKVETKPASDKINNSDSRQGQQTEKSSSETVKGNERPTPANNPAKDPDSRKRAPSRRGGAEPI